MLMVKNGIHREVPDKSVYTYKEKGYLPAEPEAPLEEKPYDKMTTAELKAAAAALGVDISDCKTNAERADLLEQATKPQDE